MSSKQAPFVKSERGFSFIRAAFLACVFAFAALVPANAKVVQDEKAFSVFERSEGVVGNKLNNYLMIDQDERQLLFSSLEGKPMLLTFMYIDCADICVIMGNYLKDFLSSIDPELREQVKIVSVSIDSVNDTPERLLKYGKEFTDDFTNWSFVTATSPETLASLIGELGFTYEKARDGFEHLNRVTLIGADGTVERHFYGADFDFAEMEESIRNVTSGSAVSTFLTRKFNSFLLYCSNYDPISKTYKVDYPFLIAAGIIFVLVAATIVLWWKPSILRYVSGTE